MHRKAQGRLEHLVVVQLCPEAQDQTRHPAFELTSQLEPPAGHEQIHDRQLERLESEHGTLPDTPVSLTGGGGQHVLFRHPGRPIKSVNGKLGRGLDLKGDGGYIVLPPSKHPSRTHPRLLRSRRPPTAVPTRTAPIGPRPTLKCG